MPQTLDLSGWPRRHHFRFFLDFEQPQFQLTSLIDVTALDAAICEHGGSRFAAMLHATMWATQAEEALRMRIRWSGSVPEVVLHEVVHPSFTAPVQLSEADRRWPGCDLPLFGYTTARYGPDFVGFAQRVRAAQERVVHDADVDRQAAQDTDDLVFVSSIPWMSFTGLQHAMKHARKDSIPRITWGRFMGTGGRVEVSVSLQAHHGLADGGHVARWFRRLQARLEQPEWVFATRLPQEP
jgi:chloramphenicol O-acetyltransferase